MFMTTGIKNLIREGTMNQIYSSIETGGKEGMVSMKKYAEFLRDKDLVLEESYIDYFKNNSDI